MRQRLDALLQWLGTAWTIDDQGGLQSSEFDVFFMEDALVQLLDLSDAGLTRSEFERCASNALRATIKARDISVDRLEVELTDEVKSWKRKPRVQYTALTHCFFGGIQSTDIPVGEHRLHFQDGPPNGFDLTPGFAGGFGNLNLGEPLGGVYCTLDVRARSRSAALDLASEAISVGFGAVNFWINLGTLRSYYGKAEVRADVFPGETVALFDANGKREDILSYYLVKPPKVKRLTKGQVSKIEGISRLFDRLSSKPKTDLKFYYNFFSLYFDALSELDVDYQIIKLWKAAEFVTFAQGADTNIVARRLSLTWKDEGLVHAICFAAGHWRNKLVHNNRRTVNSSNVFESFRDVVERSVWSSLSTKVKSIAEWKAVLELGTSGFDNKHLESATALLRSIRRRPK